MTKAALKDTAETVVTEESQDQVAAAEAVIELTEEEKAQKDYAEKEAALLLAINEKAADLRGLIAQLSGAHPFLRVVEHTLDWVVSHPITK